MMIKKKQKVVKFDNCNKLMYNIMLNFENCMKLFH